MASSVVAARQMASQDDNNLMLSPRVRRKQFTICSESDEENTPRAPNPQLSRLEAKSGLVSLTSNWPSDVNTPTEQELTGDEQSPTEPQGRNADVNDPNKVDDEDVVLVTDKGTQTDAVHVSPIPPFSSSSHQDRTDATRVIHPQLHQLGENELIRNTSDDALERQSSEAPTLSVEYVGKVWDAYINDFLLGCDQIDQAAIYDIATGKCIACSSDFAMSKDEFDHLVDVISCLNLAYKTGVDINGRHYRIILADGKRGLMAKGENRDGCSACRTRTLILIAIHNRNASGRKCNEELMRLGDFFWTKGL